MKNKKELLLSAVQLTAVITGAIITAAMNYPLGILFLLPLCAAPLSEIYKLRKKQEELKE